MNIDQIVKKHIGAYGESSVRFKQPKKERAFNRKIFYECLEPEALMVARQENTRLTMKLTGVALTARGESAGKVSKAIKTAGVVTKQALQKLWDIIVNLVEQIHRGIFGIQKNIKKCLKMIEEMDKMTLESPIELPISHKIEVYLNYGIEAAKDHAHNQAARLVRDFRKINNIYDQRIKAITDGEIITKVKTPITTTDEKDLVSAIEYIKSTKDDVHEPIRNIDTQESLKEVLNVFSVAIKTVDGIEKVVSESKKMNRTYRLKFEKMMQLNTEQNDAKEIIKDMESYMSKFRTYLPLFYGKLLKSAGSDIKSIGILYNKLKAQNK